MKIAAVFSNGFEEIELITVVDILRRAEVRVDLISIQNEINFGSHGVGVKCDKFFKKDEVLEYDAIFLPGGMPGTNILKDYYELKEVILDFNGNNKFIFAICAAPIILENADILTGRDVTSFPSFKDTFRNSNYLEKAVVRDKNIITSRGAGTAHLLAFEILTALDLSDKAVNLKKEMQYNYISEV